MEQGFSIIDSLIHKKGLGLNGKKAKNQPFDYPQSKDQGLLRVDTERRF